MKAKNWYAKFSFRDYEADIALRFCSLAAQGLWMRMLCLMDQGEPYGHLSLKGEQISDGDLARLVGAPAEEVKNLLQMLEAKEIFSRTSTGCIFNRRMVRDREISRLRSSVAKKGGGNPKLKPHAPAQPGEVLYKQKGEQEDKHYSKSQSNSKNLSNSAPTERAAALPQPTAKDLLWQQGVPALRELLGKSESATRSFLGKLLAKAGEDHAGLLEAILRGAEEHPVDPEAWLMKAASMRAEPKQRPLSATAQVAAKLQREAAARAALDRSSKTHQNVFGPIIEGVAQTNEQHQPDYETSWD